MRLYDGPATVITPDGEYEVTAHLMTTKGSHRVRGMGGGTSSLKGLDSWGGVLTVDDDGSAWAIWQAEDPELKLPEGGRGRFITVSSRVGEGIEIKGNGASPY
jgi:hypothetical protein